MTADDDMIVDEHQADRNPPPYIIDQHWSICTAWEDPWPYLTSNHFRTGRGQRGAIASGQEADSDAWDAFDFDHLVTGQYRAGDDDGNLLEQVDLHRVVITTDAGMGKTVATKALEYHLGQRSPQTLVIRMKLKDLAQAHAGSDGQMEAIVTALARQIRKNVGSDQYELDPLTQLVNRKRRSGDLALIFDGLDEAGDVRQLNSICSDADWQRVRVVVAGRPYSIRHHRHDLFRGSNWRFLRLEEFSKPQIDHYLGAMENGDRRLDKIKGCEEILGVPRVLEYLRFVDDEKLDSMSRPADIYYAAIQHLLKRGFAKSLPARLMGTDLPSGTELDEPHANNLPKAFELLGLIAYEMTSVQIEDRDPNVIDNGDPYADVKKVYTPNFTKIPTANLTAPQFIQRIKQRYQYDPKVGFDRDLNCLACLNQVLEQGVFDSDSKGGFEVFQFRNRSLQEFLCAHYLATHATNEESHGDDSDETRLWDWIYLPFEPQTEAYYHVWQFLCDMPRRCEDKKVFYGAEQRPWLNAIRPLFSRGKIEMGNDGQQRSVVKRSNEMIFRCWHKLDADCAAGNNHARGIVKHWISEFEEMLHGKHDEQKQKIAAEIRDDFLKIPGTTETGQPFTLGTPKEKQGQIPDFWHDVLRQLQELESEFGTEEAAERLVQRLAFYGSKRQQATDRSWWTRMATRILQAGDLSPVEESVSVKDEGPLRMEEVKAFRLCRRPSTNTSYRLFDPTHGLQEEIKSDYQKYSPSDLQPVIFVSWFDAWAYCLWLRWEGVSCRLPEEWEWEYACKFGTDCDKRYWWGEEFDPTRANGDRQSSETNEATPDHASQPTKELDSERDTALGLMEMLGSVNEWTGTLYREEYALGKFAPTQKDQQNPALSRVLRGGSFLSLADYCRSSYRSDIRPQDTLHLIGFRVSRA